ncbi:MAPEG family protein [Kangiella koreensis]|uniref:MAPEG family protein n=1 Tax=Kangiella koreensis TaxID=261964 RepID=UPI000A015209
MPVQGHLTDPVQLWLAWIFVAGRLIHSAVQILTNNIRLRGLVYTINFLAVLAMWFKMFF